MSRTYHHRTQRRTINQYGYTWKGPKWFNKCFRLQPFRQEVRGMLDQVRLGGDVEEIVWPMRIRARDTYY